MREMDGGDHRTANWYKCWRSLLRVRALRRRCCLIFIMAWE